MKKTMCCIWGVLAVVNMAAFAKPVLIDFVSPDALVDPRGVSLTAQLPEPGLSLLAKDSQRPKLWYAPVGAESMRSGARIWYQRVNTAEAQFSDQRTLCLGEINEGVWNLCALNPEPPAWGGVNNVCMRRSLFKPTWGGFNAFQIAGSGRHYKMLYWDQPAETGLAGAMLATSKDGKVWKKDPCGTVFTEHNDAFTLLEHKHEYLVYQTALEDWPDKPYLDNIAQKRRVITLRRSKDLRRWSSQEALLRPDAEDKRETEFYLMKAFPYGNGFAGLIMKYYADPALPGKHSAILQNELIVSADAVHWERPFRATDVGFWTFVDPVLLQDRLHFVIWKDGGMNTVTYAPHRMTAVCAGNEEGAFTTHPFRYTGGAIALNADTRNGWIVAELLAESGKQVLSLIAERIENTDGAFIPVTFKKVVKPGKYRLRFRMQQAKLYATFVNQPVKSMK